MKRSQIYLFSSLAAAGTMAIMLMAIFVAGDAPSTFAWVGFFFATLAAIFGYLGVIIAFLTFRLEAGKVPKPGLSIVAGQQLVDNHRFRIDLSKAPTDFKDAIQEERTRLLDLIPRKSSAGLERRAFGVLTAMMRWPNEEEIDEYTKEVERYLDKGYSVYLQRKANVEAYARQSAVLILAFTNQRGGVPAEGVKAVLTFPDSDDFIVQEKRRFPEVPEPPTPPSPPEIVDAMSRYMHTPFVPTFRVSSDNMAPPTIPAPRNVSGPTFRKGSVLVEFSVKEILHNTHETTGNDPLVLTFHHAGQWRIPFELHARNLQQPQTGSLQIEAYEGVRQDDGNG